jgi:RimJ/RimL family protein N-acetyltransferase
MIQLKQVNISDSHLIKNWKDDITLATDIMAYKNKSLTLKDAEEWIIRNTSDKNQRLFGIYYFPENSQSNNSILIGVFRLMFIDFQARVAEVGLFIGDRSYLGKGNGSKVLAVGISIAFEKLGLRKLFARIRSGNFKSRKLFEKKGFINEGNLKKHFYNSLSNEFEDVLIFSFFNPMFI